MTSKQPPPDDSLMHGPLNCDLCNCPMVGCHVPVNAWERRAAWRCMNCGNTYWRFVPDEGWDDPMG